MKAGTLIELSDGRRGRVVYHHLDGTGIQIDCPPLADEQIDSLNQMEAGDDLKPDVMLREPYKNSRLECVADYEVINEDNRSVK